MRNPFRGKVQTSKQQPIMQYLFLFHRQSGPALLTDASIYYLFQAFRISGVSVTETSGLLFYLYIPLWLFMCRFGFIACLQFFNKLCDFTFVYCAPK